MRIAIVQLRRYIDLNNLSSNFKLDVCVLKSYKYIHNCVVVAYIVRRNAMLNILRELPLESFIVLFFQSSHVICDVLAEYVLSVYICIEGLRFAIISRESLGAVKQNTKLLNTAEIIRDKL